MTLNPKRALSSIYSVGFYSKGLLHHNRGKHTFPVDLEQAKSIASNQRNLYTKSTYGDGGGLFNITSPSSGISIYASYLFSVFGATRSCIGLVIGLIVGWRIVKGLIMLAIADESSAQSGACCGLLCIDIGYFRKFFYTPR